MIIVLICDILTVNLFTDINPCLNAICQGLRHIAVF